MVNKTIAIFCCVFVMFSSIGHSMIVPLFWMSAVVADLFQDELL
jgi:hypothetical protein